MNGGEGYFEMILLQRNMLFNDGVKFMEEGEFQRSEQKFNDILTSINDLQAMFQLARCYQFSRDYDSALETYSQVFQKNQFDPRPIYQQGYIMDLLGQKQKAIQFFEKARRVFENNRQSIEDQFQYSIIYYSLGLKYEEQKMIKEACIAFKNCASLKNPADEQIALQKIKILEENCQQHLEASSTFQFKQNNKMSLTQTNSNEEIIKNKQISYKLIITEDKKKRDYNEKDSEQLEEKNLLFENLDGKKSNPSPEKFSSKINNQGSGILKQNKPNSGSIIIKNTGSNITKNSSSTNKIGSNNKISEEVSPIEGGKASKSIKLRYQEASQLGSEHDLGNKRHLKSGESQVSNQSDKHILSHPFHKGSSNFSTKALTGDQSDFPIPSTITLTKNYQYSSDMIYSEKLKELDSQHQNRIDKIQFQNPLYPSYEYNEEMLSDQEDQEVPDEKDGQMMKKLRNFENIHNVKQMLMKSFVEINSQKPSQISGMSASNFNNNGESGTSLFTMKNDFEHLEKTLDAYQTRRQLGEGSFGKVFEVIYKTDGNSFALKILPNNSILRKHLANGEVEVMKQLNHKNVIKIYNAFKSDDHQSYCIISELADNGTLKEYIQRTKGKIDKHEILNIMKQMMTALQYIHSKRIVHRDIKPGNMFLHGISRQIKIGDFGIAKKLQKKEVEQALLSFGTEKYISPEYMTQGFSSSSDVWSMGIVFLELLGVNVTEGLTLESKMKYFKQIPPELSDIIAGMIQYDPQARSNSVTVINQLKLIK